MEYSQINALTKFGSDDYGLWQLTINDPARAGVLDSIIHKVECCLPAENAAPAHEQEHEYDREE